MQRDSQSKTASRARGQHAGLTREAVLAAAVDLVDAHGLRALSMRRLGAELGVEAMALYHHVGSKEELLDGLVEQLFAEVVPAIIDAAGGAHDETDWRAALRVAAHAVLDSLLAHPNLVPVVLSRPAATPQMHQHVEQVLGVLQVAGLSPGRSLDLLYAVIGFVVAHVATGGGAGDSIPARRALLSSQDLSGFPLLAQAAREEAPPGQSPFEVTLEALLAWFDPLVPDR